MLPTNDEFVNQNILEQKRVFRKSFQPSKILIGVFPAPTRSGYNLITLCYQMWCSKNPVMMAIAIHNINATYNLLGTTTEFVLSVPGESLAKETIYCGTKSMKDTDKIIDLNIKLRKSKTISVPGISNSIGNIELKKDTVISTGDHDLLIARVLNFDLLNNEESPLLSIGPNLEGYNLVLKDGIHRIATIKK